MTTPKQKAMIALVALAAGSGGLVLSQNRNSRANGTYDGSALIDLALLDANGGRQSLTQWRGKVLAVNFWASWCAPCREEMPAFSRTSEEYAAKGVQFVGIGIDSVDNLREFSGQIRVAYPLLVGESDAMQASAAVGNTLMALPFTAVLSRKGKVTQVKLGKMEERELKDALDKALAAD